MQIVKFLHWKGEVKKCYHKVSHTYYIEFQVQVHVPVKNFISVENKNSWQPFNLKQVLTFPSVVNTVEELKKYFSLKI